MNLIKCKTCKICVVVEACKLEFLMMIHCLYFVDENEKPIKVINFDANGNKIIKKHFVKYFV